jgi:DNA-directed RNA polymerase specialized sigma24 family protein
MRRGDDRAREALLADIYRELRNMAAAQLGREAAGHTLQPTALVNEVYLKLFAADQELAAESRGSLMATAARAMRQVLVDHARAKHTLLIENGQPSPLPGYSWNQVFTNECAWSGRGVLALS